MGQAASNPARAQDNNRSANPAHGSNPNNTTGPAMRRDSESEEESFVDASSVVSGGESASSSRPSSGRSVLARLRRTPRDDGDSTGLSTAREADVSGSGSRRRRRTSSSDETVQNLRKRRHRSSALRRLGQFGSNVVHSLSPSSEPPSATAVNIDTHDTDTNSSNSRDDLRDASSRSAEDSRAESREPSSSAASRLRPLSEMFNQANSSLSSLSSADSSLDQFQQHSSSSQQPQGSRGSRPFQLFDRLFSNDPLPPLSSLTQRSERRPSLFSRPPIDSFRSYPRGSSSASSSMPPLDPLLLRPRDRDRPGGGGTSSTGPSEGSFEYQAAMLSRLLAIAASVTASSIMGDRDRRGVGIGRSATESPDQDNSFSGFINGLHNGLLVSELANSVNRQNNQDAADGEPRRSSNFFRMFRFPPSQPTAGEGPGLVPVLIVGVRAVDGNEEEAGEETAAAGAGGGGNGIVQDPSGLSFFDAMSSRSIRMNNNATSSATNGEETAENSAAQNNRSTNNSNNNSTNNDEDSLLNRLRRAHQTRMQSQNLFDSIFRPDRATPQSAEDGGSTSSSDEPSSSQVQPPTDENEGDRESTSEQHTPRRQSWIIYVIGGSYPEDHPILLAPSLFTDNPTYEDMLVLERVLGQAKPPVATKEEVSISGGLYKIGDPEVELRPDERCLVCLSSYETGEEVRRLKLCGHLFHQECIDQWLTTGRNSCPLCRGEGVKKAQNPEAPKTTDCS
ncbi:hypothetical protein TRVA0_020S00166 [Trichomonascus vanleenenianus]|uniref:RING-H2 finger protein n=1 Tax=Trichomonascus vanleenenianus TaxID=2268995 RepID=UPI003ECA8217